MSDNNKISNNTSNNGTEPQAEKLWGGRFTQPTDKFVEEFTASIGFEQRLGSYDIQGSKAHAEMLGRQGIIAVTEAQQIIAGL